MSGPFRTLGRRDADEPASPPDGDFRLQTWESLRTCPGCRSRMFAARCAGVRIDGCDACGGSWVPADEIEKVRARASALSVILAGLSAARDDAAPTFLEGTRLCPDCSALLSVVPIERGMPGAAEAPRVDRCRLHGTFFDRTELASFVGAAFGTKQARTAETIPSRGTDASVPDEGPDQAGDTHPVASLLERLAAALRDLVG
jgi:Zn-finger nucleic acid-binding protein